jgi:hypothetical protein
MSRDAPRPSKHFAWDDWRVDDCRGRRVGTLAAVYEDLSIAAPAWFLVRLSGYSSRFAMTPPAELLGWHGRVCLPYERTTVERGPLLYSVPAAVTATLEARLRRHYGLRSVSDDSLRVRRSVA